MLFCYLTKLNKQIEKEKKKEKTLYHLFKTG